MTALAVVIPTLNEEANIVALIRGVLKRAPPDLVEVLVADGGSRDRTRELVDALGRVDSRVRLLPNSARIQAAGCNLAARAAREDVEVLVRMDAHAAYPGDYVQRLCTTLQETGADSVVVRLTSQGRTCFQRAVAAASNSRLGAGGAAHRVGGRSGWIDHGHHAAFRRASFLKLGGYDETFPANEDAEFDARLRQAGGRIWLAADLAVIYWPRASAIALARQYFRYGVGRIRNVRKTGERLRLRQLAAPMVVLGCSGAGLVGFALPVIWLIPAVYAAAACAFGLMLAVRARKLCVAASGLAAIVMHLSWGAGFWWGLAGGDRQRGSSFGRTKGAWGSRAKAAR